MNKQQLLSRVNPGKSGKQKSLKMLVFQAFVMNYNDSGGERGICPVLSIPLLLSLSAVIKNLLTEILTSFFDCFWCKSVL